MSERLCYIEGAFAYFTTQPLEDQWGDDWNDAPYEHNAGTPYEAISGRNIYSRDKGWHDPKEDWQILKVAFESGLETPDCGHFNSPYSVQQINRREVAWLRDPVYGEADTTKRYLPVVWAGICIDEFTSLIEGHGGTVYVPVAWTRSPVGDPAT